MTGGWLEVDDYQLTAPMELGSGWQRTINSAPASPSFFPRHFGGFGGFDGSVSALLGKLSIEDFSLLATRAEVAPSNPPKPPTA